MSACAAGARILSDDANPRTAAHAAKRTTTLAPKPTMPFAPMLPEFTLAATACGLPVEGFSTMSYSNAIRGAAALIGVLIAAQSMAAGADEGLVCRYESRPGSRLLSHPCLTEAQWAETDKRQAMANPLRSLTALPGLSTSPAFSGPGTVTAVSVNLNR